jgi:putative acetyltransferase
MKDAPKKLAPDSAGARRLLALSDEFMASLYPAESNHMESVEALQAANVCFLGIEDGGEVVACGAVKVMHDGVAYGEIKRLFVLPGQRGKGHARRIMLALLAELRDRGIAMVRLEVGISQPEALGLYHALGFRQRDPFGSYAPDPYSVFMEKALQD